MVAASKMRVGYGWWLVKKMDIGVRTFCSDWRLIGMAETDFDLNSQPPYVLNERKREIVLAAHVRSNHVHLILEAGGEARTRRAEYEGLR